MNNHLFIPDYSHITGLLQQLNDDELKELLNNEDKLKAIVHDLKQVHDIEAEREMQIASNKSLAEYNFSKKPDLESHRKQVDKTRQIALELKDSFLEKKRKIESSEKATSKETILALLQAATSEIEEEAEAYVEHFLKREMSIEDFLEKYLELKKLAHLRRMKSEKLTGILQGGIGQSLSPPTRPQRLRTPPAPPVSRPELPYPNPTSKVGSNNFNYGPVRTAPHPPVNNFAYPLNMYAQNQAQPVQPFSSVPTPYQRYCMPSTPAYPPFQ